MRAPSGERAAGDRRGPTRPCRLRTSPTTSTTGGLVCGHHHLYSALARGMPRPAASAHRLPRDPGADLVAARRRPRPGDDPVVGHARRARGAGVRHHGHRRPPRVAQRHRGQPVGHRRRRAPRSGCGSCLAYGVTDRHGARRGPPGAGGERAVPARRRPGHGRRPRRLHLFRRHPGGGRRAGRRPRRRRPHPRGRGRRSTPRPAPGWPRWPGPTGCSSTASTSTATCRGPSPTTPGPT